MSAPKARTEKHRKAHKLVQAWVSPELHKALGARAKKEERSLANFVRRELGKLVEFTE
jgi:predicted HicB family RNase H-like nuclease